MPARWSGLDRQSGNAAKPARHSTCGDYPHAMEAPTLAAACEGNPLARMSSDVVICFQARGIEAMRGLDLNISEHAARTLTVLDSRGL
jgi:hypothetical protein